MKTHRNIDFNCYRSKWPFNRNKNCMFGNLNGHDCISKLTVLSSPFSKIYVFINTDYCLHNIDNHSFNRFQYPVNGANGHGIVVVRTSGRRFDKGSMMTCHSLEYL